VNGRASTPTPKVTVAVSTYQRAGSVLRLVKALEGQTLDRDAFEVVIADDGSTDETPAVLDELVRTSPLHITVLRSDRNRGQAVGRNRAWAAARAPVVAFTDDDCQPQPKWLEAGLEAMSHAKIVVGRTAPPPDQQHLTAGPFARTLRVEDARFFQTANVFYWKSDLEAVGGFDETFVLSGEDTELALRVSPAGAGAVFVPDALVYHDVRPSDFGAAARELFRWVDLPHVIALHPDRRDLLHRRYFWRAAHPPVLLAMAGMAGALLRRNPALLLLVLPWIRHRVQVAPLSWGPRRRWIVLPAAFVLDFLEVAVMVRGSIRHRALVL
jgi:GT2 family glycosyltransferase